MPANEFEKQVQKQLDDFQLNPSASVWKKVEEQIRKKKRRRVVFFILLPLVLGLLGYSVYFFLYSGQKSELVQQPVSTKNEKILTTDKTNTAIESKEQVNNPQLPEAGEQDALTEKKETPKKRTANTRNDELPNNPSANRIKNKPAIKRKDEITTTQKKSETSLLINNDIPAKPDIPVTINKPGTGAITNKETSKKPLQKTSDKKDSVIVASKDSVIVTAKDSVIVTAKDIVSVKTDTIKTDDVINSDSTKEIIAIKKTGKPKMKWGIDFSAGITSNQSGIFSLNKSYDRLYNSPATSSGGPGGIANPPSSIRSGPAFRIGVVGELQVSERSRLSAGLQYVYSSNKIKTGAEIDTTLQLQSTNNSFMALVERVYRGPQQSNYTNRYHFVSIPFWYHWQINKSKKLPLQWNVGVSFSYLLATNALVYSSSYGGIYYHDKAAFNKAHFNIGTGLSFRLQGNNGMEWVLGPELSFGTMKLVNDGYDKKQYLLFGGINAKLFFPKKKK